MTSVARKRSPIPANVRKEVLDRDHHACRKCRIQRGVEVHHKHAVFDGGSNDLDNLICLCTICHREWHGFFEGLSAPTFDEWLTVPPVNALVVGWLQAPEHIDFFEWQASLWVQWLNLVHQKNAELQEKC